jgi:hypothetical protein
MIERVKSARNTSSFPPSRPRSRSFLERCRCLPTLNLSCTDVVTSRCSCGLDDSRAHLKAARGGRVSMLSNSTSYLLGIDERVHCALYCGARLSSTVHFAPVYHYHLLFATAPTAASLDDNDSAVLPGLVSSILHSVLCTPTNGGRLFLPKQVGYFEGLRRRLPGLVYIDPSTKIVEQSSSIHHGSGELTAGTSPLRIEQRR